MGLYSLRILGAMLSSSIHVEKPVADVRNNILVAGVDPIIFVGTQCGIFGHMRCLFKKHYGLGGSL